MKIIQVIVQFSFGQMRLSNINGTNTKIHGFYVAAAATGRLSATQNIAMLTHKTLSGFSILRDKMLREVTKNA